MELPRPAWLQSLDTASRLLLHALGSGPAGALAALRLLQRGRASGSPGQGFPWQPFTAALCAEEPTLDGLQGALAVKPRLLLLPIVCQRNLLSLLLVLGAVVPRGCLGQLLQALGQDSHGDPWVQALRELLQQGARAGQSSPAPTALSPGCQQQLRSLGRKITQNKRQGQRKLKWCLSEQPRAPGDVAESVLQRGKRKKVLEESLELEEEREGKRLLLEEVLCDSPATQQRVAGPEEVPGDPSGDRCAQSPDGAAPGGSQQEAAREPRQTSQAELAAEVQSFVQVHGPRLKMLLQKEPSHLEPIVLPELRALNNCSASQVLSLTRPPSRHLMAALTSFCSKYPQPFCRVLLPAVLQEPGQGSEQTKLVCELVEECLEPECVPLVLSQVLELPLSEKLLPVIQSVLGRQEVLPPELLDLLVLTLCQQAPALATLPSYTKLVTAVLTMHQSQVTPAHRSSLATALHHSNTALTKSLQAMLGGAR
ncbi:Fanconi anemia group E protein isoform X3 [Colius striatus]|uniref:Fanconi anemia group E protein isoform X3 n=1 Tax=Colius striatus TaxID=57412 RepID=UPI002B1E8B77|nr:Fanconi anemia group E protein isoform X3 [Colius striatus]